MPDTFYRRLDSTEPDGTPHSVSVGIHEVMPAGILQRPNGWRGLLFMYFHTPVRVAGTRNSGPSAGDTALLWSRGMPQEFGHHGQSWDHSWLSLDCPKLEQAFAGIQVPWGKPFPCRAEASITPILRLVHSELLRSGEPEFELLEQAGRLLGRLLEREWTETSLPPPEPSLARVRAFISNHLDRTLSLRELAAVAGCSVSHLGARFRATFGQSVMQYVEEQRLQRAASALANRARPIQSVAEEFGYDDPLYFSRRFRRFHGASPREFRRRL